MPEIPELQGRLGDEIVELRAISEWDIPEILIAHQDDRDMHRRLGTLRPPTGAQLGSEVEHADEERRAGTRIALTIVEPGQNYCRGRIDVHAIDWHSRSAEIGIWVAPDYRGRGFARHALALAARWLFEQAGLSSLELRTEAGNAPMLAAATAAGFTETGSSDGAPAGAPSEAQIVLTLTPAGQGD